MKRILMLVLISYSTFTCSKDKYPVDMNGFTYFRVGNYDNQFRIDGVYLKSEDTTSVWGFYADGTFCSCLKPSHIKGKYIISDWARTAPYCWGAYIVQNNIIKIQSFASNSREYNNKFQIGETHVNIINDTTIHVYKKIFPQKPKRDDINVNILLQFQPCNKPDSMNILMTY
jgi:hypothetical protein